MKTWPFTWTPPAPSFPRPPREITESERASIMVASRVVSIG